MGKASIMPVVVVPVTAAAAAIDVANRI